MLLSIPSTVSSTWCICKTRSAARLHFWSASARKRLGSSHMSQQDILLALQQDQYSVKVSPRPEVTFNCRQVCLTFTQNVIFLLALHVCSLVVGLIKSELIRTCSTGEGIDACRMLVAGSSPCDGQTITAIRADCRKLENSP